MPTAPRLLAKLDAMLLEHDGLRTQLEDPALLADQRRAQEVSHRLKAVAPVVERYKAYRALAGQVAEHEQLAADPSDVEMAALAAGELPGLRGRAERLIEEIAGDLVTAEDRAVGEVILEVRAGTGGAEAALFAGELLRMYQRHCERRGWRFSLMEASEGEAGGIRSATVQVKGDGVWQGLGYESGVHCVKRVPATETQGRIHTSTATVAVLPAPEKVQLDVPEHEVRVDITTAQGPGGQNVNKVATAVKLLHLPTGIEVRMQESKSQHQNREKAWTLLRARIYEHHQRQKDAQRAEQRSAMIGSGARTERVRTYRWKESQVVDHRVNAGFALQKIMDGELDEMVAALAKADREERLANL